MRIKILYSTLLCTLLSAGLPGLSTQAFAERIPSAEGNHPRHRADRPRVDRPRADRPRADRSRADRHRADRPRADRPRADRSRADRSRADRLRADRLRADRPRADRPRVDRPRADRPPVVVRPHVRAPLKKHQHPDYWRNKYPRNRYYGSYRYKYPHRYYYPRRPYRYRSDDFFGWLAFTAVTLAIIDNLNEHQQREHELTLREALKRPVGETIRWSDSEASGTVTITREGRSSEGRYCREYTQEVRINNQSQQVYGTACRDPDGSWEILN